MGAALHGDGAQAQPLEPPLYRPGEIGLLCITRVVQVNVDVAGEDYVARGRAVGLEGVQDFGLLARRE
eukprot:4082938-Lingulodinium_polyedra.AAC.1